MSEGSVIRDFGLLYDQLDYFKHHHPDLGWVFDSLRLYTRSLEDNVFEQSRLQHAEIIRLRDRISELQGKKIKKVNVDV
jgi:hypothetical protein